MLGTPSLHFLGIANCDEKISNSVFLAVEIVYKSLGIKGSRMQLYIKAYTGCPAKKYIQL